MIQVDAFQDGDEGVMSPPLAPVAVIIIAIACLLQWLQPIQIIADIAFIEDIDPDSLSLVGLVVAIAGLALSVSGLPRPEIAGRGRRSIAASRRRS